MYGRSNAEANLTMRRPAVLIQATILENSLFPPFSRLVKNGDSGKFLNTAACKKRILILRFCAWYTKNNLILLKYICTFMADLPVLDVGVGWSMGRKDVFVIDCR